MDQITTTISPLAIDLAFATIILFVAAIRAKAGLYHCVMSVVIIIVAIAIGLVGSKIFTPVLKDYVWKDYGVEVEEKFDKEVEDALNGEESIRKVFQKSWNNAISGFGDNEVTKTLTIKQQDIDYTDSELVAKLKIYTLVKAELMVEKVCRLGLFGVITAVFLLLLTMLKNIIGEVADFSVVGWVNHGGGFILGAVEAIVFLILIVRGAGLLNIRTFAELSEGTVLLKWLVGGDIQGSITALQNMTIEDLKNIKLEDLTTVDFNQLSDQVKEAIKNIDLTNAPKELTDALDKVDVEQLTENTKEIIDTIKDTNISPDAIVNDVKDTVKNAVTDTVKDALTDAVKGAAGN